VSLELARDSKIIAMHSKQDSSAMKTLALVTMVFLPGTFVASLFSMPLFDWTSAGDVTRPRFRIYWAVAVPLTAVTLMIYGIWSMWIKRRARARTEQAIHTLDRASGETELAVLSHQRAKTSQT
jgi:hypothetical protein